jgi:hypothetical protein
MQILALDPPVFTQTCGQEQRRSGWCAAGKDADASNPLRLLRARCDLA